MAAPLCSLQTLPAPMTPLPKAQPAPDAEAEYRHLMQQVLLPPLHSIISEVSLHDLLSFDQLLRDKENIPPKNVRPASPPHTSLTHPEEFEL